MTVIAFDGKTLAADRQSTSGDCMAYTVRKIARTPDGCLIAACGDAAHAGQLMRWAMGGFSGPFPAAPSREAYADLWCVQPDGAIRKYENSPEPSHYLDTMFVAGCGREAAMGAMVMGADARRAVEVACEVNIHCGMGIDTLSLEEP